LPDQLTHYSYIVYLVLQCGYLALIIMFFPETRSVNSRQIRNNRANVSSRRLSIEEVSVLFDTGRLGNAGAATAILQQDQKNPSLAEPVVLDDKQGGVSMIEHEALQHGRHV